MKPTYVACLTPPGTAALATLGLTGPRAWDIARAVFSPSLPDEPQPGKFWLGKIGDDLGRDEVVLAVKAIDPELTIEIHCHGGRYVLQWLQDILEERGAIRCSPTEWAAANRSPEEAALMDGLAHALTVRTAAILLDQYHGAFKRALAKLDELQRQGQTNEARALLDSLQARVALGQHLTAPWRVVIAGAVNAGKSSLVNALAGHTRSVVSPQPGTTRDVVTTRLAVDGWPIEIADTAGLRTAGDALEQEGIARARAAMASADVVVWLLDGSTEAVFPEAVSQRCLLVVNKIDLPAAWDSAGLSGSLRVSALTGEGVEELCQRLSQILVPNPPAPGDAVPFGEADRQARR